MFTDVIYKKNGIIIEKSYVNRILLKKEKKMEHERCKYNF